MTFKIQNLNLGIKILTPERFSDERGIFTEVLRSDWADFFDNSFPKQVNLSKSYPGIIRAWHRHDRGQIDYMMILNGSVKICVWDGNKTSKTFGNLVEVTLSEDNLQIIRIPGNLWHGTKTIGTKPSLTVYFINNLYNYKNPDEERRPWNDPFVIDPKTKKPYDWNMPPHK